MNTPSRIEEFFRYKEADTAYRWTALAEQNLASNFETWVGQLDLAELISRRQKPPRGLGRYALVPITTDDEHNIGVLSFEGAGQSYKVPSGIIVEKPEPQVISPDVILPPSREPLFVDTAFAIGLARDGILRAVSATYISPEFRKLINVQNQGLVESKPELGRDNPALRSGLFGGFFWQDILVLGWITIAEKLGADQFVIAGANNNHWAERLGKRGKKEEELPKDSSDPQWEEMRLAGVAMLKKNLDDVADRLDFTEQPDGDWLLDLPTTRA